MNTGQLLLVLGALALLSTITLTVHTTIRNSEDIALESQAGMMALAVCQGRLDETAAMPFDSLATGTLVDTVQTNFAAYGCTTRVEYVTAVAPDSVVTGPTDLKRIEIAVINDYLTQSVTLRTIVGDI